MNTSKPSFSALSKPARSGTMRRALSAAVLASMLMSGTGHAGDSPFLDVRGIDYTPTGEPEGAPTAYETHIGARLSEYGTILSGSEPFSDAIEITSKIDLESGQVGIRLFGDAWTEKDSQGPVFISAEFALNGDVQIREGYLIFDEGGTYSGTGALTIASDASLAINTNEETHFKLTTLANVINDGKILTIQQGKATINVAISGSGELIQDGLDTSRTTLSAATAQTYTGGTSILGGTLATRSDNQLGNGHLQLSRYSPFARSALDIGSTTQHVESLHMEDYSAILGEEGGKLVSASTYEVISGVINVELGESGEPPHIGLRKRGMAGDELQLGKANTYTGQTEVNGGLLILQHADAIAQSRGLYVRTIGPVKDDIPEFANEAAQFDVNGYHATVNGKVTLDDGGRLSDIAGGGSLAIAENAANHTFQLNDGTVDLVLAGEGVIEKNTSGNVSLNRRNTLSGPVNINEGTLATTVDHALAGATSLSVAGPEAVFEVIGTHQSIAGEIVLERGLLLDSSGTSYLERTGSLASDGSPMRLWSGEVSVRLVNADDGTATDINKESEGIVLLHHQNEITGDVRIFNGTLAATVDSGFAQADRLILGVDGSPFLEPATLELLGTSQSVTSDIAVYRGFITDSIGGGKLQAGEDFYFYGAYVSANLAGAGEAIIEGSPDDITVFAAQNEYTGATRIGSGTLQTRVDNAFANSTGLTLYSTGEPGEAVLDLSGTQQRVNGVVTLADGAIVDHSPEGGGVLSATSYHLRSGDVDVVLAGGEEVHLIKTNHGGLNTTVYLNAANTYQGHTFVHEGRLQAGVPDAIAASSGLTIENTSAEAGTMAIFNVGGNNVRVKSFHLINGIVGDSSAFQTGSLISEGDFIVEQGTIAATLAGDASLVKNTDREVSLVNVNTYRGATIVNAGLLSLGESGALPEATTLFLAEGASLKLTGTTQKLASLNGSVEDGRGGLIDLGQAEWGDSGTLEIGLGDADSRFSGEIVGSGLVRKVGEGRLDLTGVIDIDGPVEVNEGFLHLSDNGSLNVTGNVVVQEHGILSGNGRIGGNLLNASLVIPGNSPGTIIVHGDYTQTARGGYHVDIESRHNYDRLHIGGKAYLDGSLVTVITPGSSYRPRRHDRLRILRAEGGREGRFDAHWDNFPKETMLTLGLHYTPKSVWLIAQQHQFADLGGLTHNQRQIARAVDHAAAHDQLEKLFDTLNYTHVSNIPGLLSELSPEQLTSIFTISVASAQAQNINIERRLDDVRNGSVGFSANGLSLRNQSGGVRFDGAPIANTADGLTLAGWDGGSIISKTMVIPSVDPRAQRWGFFATGHGEWANIRNSHNAAGQEFTSAGFTIGADYRVSEHFVVGIQGGYTNTQSDLLRNGNLEVDGGRGGLYASFFGNGAYLNAAVGGGYNAYRTKRNTVGGFAHGNTDGGEFNALLGLGYDAAFGSFSIGPVGSLQYTYSGLNAFSENGSTAPLHYKSQHADSLRSLVGLKLAGAIGSGSVVFRPEVRAQWKHEYMDAAPSLTSRFSGGNAYFSVNGPNLGRDSLVLDAGASLEFNQRWSLFAYYTGELGRSHYDSHSVNGGLRVAF